MKGSFSLKRVIIIYFKQLYIPKAQLHFCEANMCFLLICVEENFSLFTRRKFLGGNLYNLLTSLQRLREYLLINVTEDMTLKHTDASKPLPPVDSSSQIFMLSQTKQKPVEKQAVRFIQKMANVKSDS